MWYSVLSFQIKSVLQSQGHSPDKVEAGCFNGGGKKFPCCPAFGKSCQVMRDCNLDQPPMSPTDLLFTILSCPYFLSSILHFFLFSFLSYCFLSSSLFFVHSLFFLYPSFSPFISNFVVLKIEPSSLHIMYNHSNVIKFPNTILFIIYCDFSER